MSGWVAVLVDNKELVRFARLRDGATGALNLTTILPEQDRASVEIHLVNGRNSTHVHTFHAGNIRRDGHRPEIVVSSRVGTTLEVSLRVDGTLAGSETFAIPADMTAFHPGPLIAIMLGLLALVGLGWGIWWAVGHIDARIPREQLAEIAVLEDAGDSRAAAPPDATARGPADPAAPTAADTDTDLAAGDPDPQTDPPESRPTPPATELEATELEATVLFEPERADLQAPAREALDRIAAALERWVTDGGDPASIRVDLVGHTALYGNEESRVALSGERASSAGAYLRERLRESGIVGAEMSLAGRGGREPVTRSETDQWRNRRVEIAVSAGDP